jgi:hypothetical protein
MMRRPRAWAAVCLALVCLAAPAATQSPARNVIIVTIDGLRWQELFGGAQSDYFSRSRAGEPSAIEQSFSSPTAEARRSALMPFFWGVVARQGQVFGDPSRNSRARVTNGLWFSYPGYSEMFAGVADARIDSNDKVPNPNVTVLEWLNGRDGFRGRVAAFGAWDVLPSILNVERSRLPVGSGFTPVPAPKSDRDRAINQLARDLPPYWPYGTFDAPIVQAAVESLRRDNPRVLYVMLGEGDEFAHEGRYDLYLDATHRADRFIQRLWETAASLPTYRGRTTLLITTDHGRGATVTDWADHGRKVPSAEHTWMAALGPGIPSLGIREGIDVTASQLAATIAAIVGEDFRMAVPTAAPPLPFGR